MTAGAATDSTPKSALLSRCAGVAVWLLLAGYLILNKPFATLGVAPLYVGEAVFALALLAGLADWRATFLEPLKHSWGFRALGLLWLYAVARALWNVHDSGLLALRDGAMIGYGLLAFLVPALWRRLARSADAVGLAGHAANFLLPIGLLAAIVSAGVLFGWWPQDFNTRLKVDFVTLAAAVGAWAGFIAAVKWIDVGGYYSQARRRDGVYRWILVAFYFAFALWASSVVLRLPTRAVLAGAAPLAVLFLAAWLGRPWQRAVLGAVLVLLVAVALYTVRGRTAFYATFPERFALTQHAQTPLKDLEPLMARALAGDAGAIPEELRARFEMLVPAGDPALANGPNPGEHSLRWRIVFWLRLWHVTLAQAPLTGSGFGGNLTAAMLPTRAWPDYIPSQQMSPPNRSPHAIHVNLFARLGLLGAALWLAVLIFTAAAALRAAWAWRAQRERRSREAFYDLLTLLGTWVLFLCAASFGVVIEGPYGGIWFWTLTGLLLSLSLPAPSEAGRLPG